MNRDEQLTRLKAEDAAWDILVIGGGATGAGIAVDAASRGYRTCLVEQSDFGKGTSSRSTKLVHGGVRYLQQGNIGLVREALRERGILRGNAPSLVRELAFVIPGYAWWHTPYYGAGLKLYDLLAGKYGFPRSRMLSRDQALAHAPSLRLADLRGGLVYYDGQFDDARLLIALVSTAVEHRACVVNYAGVTGLTKGGGGRVTGARIRDAETDEEFDVQAKVVVNATGAFIDEVRRLDDADASELVAPSQGVHLVFDRSFLPGDAAVVVPRTSDGRVLFAIPWLGHTLAGTTDTPVERASLEPRALDEEIDFILETVGRYLERAPSRADVRSVFAGVRPLIRKGAAKKTAALSREHTILVSPSGLISITGGKWTTYRVMARDCVDEAARAGGLPRRPCVTEALRLDCKDGASRHSEGRREDEPLHPALDLCAPDVVRAVRLEMARTVDDVLARRHRALFLNARAAMEVAPAVASLVAQELGRDDAWVSRQVAAFRALASGYLPTTG